MNKFKKKGARGVTLLEVMMVLGVMALILAILAIIMAICHSGSELSSTESELSVIVDTVRQLQNKGEYNPTSAGIIKFSDFSKKYVSSDGSAILDYNGNPIALSVTSGYFGVTLSKVSLPLCNTLPQWGLQGDFNSVLVNGSDYSTGKSTCKTSNTVVFQIYPSDASTGSSGNSSSGSGSSGSDTSSNSGSSSGSGSGSGNSGSGSDDNSTPALNDAESNLAALMKAQMEIAAAAKTLYASSTAQAAEYQAQAQQYASQGNYDAMNQAYNNMNQAQNQKNQALNQWNQALDYGNQINSATQGIYANTGQNQASTDKQVSAASQSVNYVNPIPGGIG